MSINRPRFLIIPNQVVNPTPFDSQQTRTKSNMNFLNFDSLNIIKDFVGQEYISVAPLSTYWKDVWGSSPKTTICVDEFTTIRKLNLFMKTSGRKSRRIGEDIVRGGRLDFLRLYVDYVGRKGYAWDEKSICNAAASSGHIHILEWVKENCKLSEYDFYLTVVNGASDNWEVIKWVTDSGWRFKEGDFDTRQVEICVNAASAGRLDVFGLFVCNQDMLDDDDFDEYQKVSDEAIKGGNLELLKCAVENESELCEFSCNVAARAGRLEVLEWLHDQGYCFWPTDSEYEGTIQSANGNREIIAWLISKDCPQ